MGRGGASGKLGEVKNDEQSKMGMAEGRDGKQEVGNRSRRREAGRFSADD